MAEVLVLTTLFDAESFDHDSRWWVYLLRNSGYVPRLALVAVVAVALGGQRLRTELEADPTLRDRPHRAGLFLAGHLVAFAIFAALTDSVWGEAARPTLVGGWKLLAWVLAGLATAVLWAAILLPAAQWGVLARRGLGVLSVGALLGVVAWDAGQWTQSFWTPLCRATLGAVVPLLRVGFKEVTCDPTHLVVGTSTFSVTVGPACSGCEGIGLIWTLLGGSLWIFRERFRFPRAWLLIPIGTALIWLANVARIAGLVAVGTLIAPALAVGGFHSYTGWLAFNLVGLGLIAAALRCRFFLADAPAPGEATRSNPTAACLMPFLTLVAAAMVTGAITQGFDRYYPLRMLAVAAAFAWHRRDYAGPRPTWSWGALGIGVAVFVLWMALEPRQAGPAAGFDPRKELTPTLAFAWLLARVFGSVLIVPLAEELAFRGYLIRRLLAADILSIPPGRFTWISLALSSAAFGALHGRWLAGTLAGVCYALALYRRGQLGDAVLAHATTNALIAAYVLATGTWSLWS
ncbi:MAG: exosortase E/protease, VPEID-CTERM system [Planctomycetaceae bacterium]|nr:exosortase E/protease, VPEID-CTERM system [Planctomycetaceae bacterium]MBV8235778.1 exosortase E/protease, VPEID-CTERM system [Acidimicrobiia bacterium]